MDSTEPKVVVAVAKVGLRAVAIVTRAGHDHFVEVSGQQRRVLHVRGYAEAIESVLATWPLATVSPRRSSGSRRVVGCLPRR